jgi:hypothetical protein
MPDRFQRFSGEIVKFRTDGHRIVRAGRRNVDIGPIQPPVGATVHRALLVSETHAICLEKLKVSNNYDEYLKELSDRFDIPPQAAQHVPYQCVEYSSPTPGDTFAAEIEKKNSTVGYVNLAGEQIKIGPVCAEQGQEVNLRYIQNGFAYCTDRHFQAENYENRMAILSEQYDQVPINVGETYQGEVIISHSDAATVMINGVHINVRNIDLSEGQSVKIKITGFAAQSANGVAVDYSQPQTSDSSTVEENDRIESNSEVDSSETSAERSEDQPAADVDTDTSASAETIDETREPAGGSDVAESPLTDAVDAMEDDEATRDAPTTAVGSATSTASSKPTSQLKSLRAEAEAAASDDPVRDTSSAGGGSRYQRAPEIKEYARARADGVCEVCDEPAPFETDAGRPYLEIHHIEELGQGGEDHPDKVAAVCPTCHKRIHHGADGDALNEGLRERLEEGLADVGTGVDDSVE